MVDMLTSTICKILHTHIELYTSINMKDIFDFDINILIKEIDNVIESKENKKIQYDDILYNCVCHLLNKISYTPCTLSSLRKEMIDQKLLSERERQVSNNWCSKILLLTDYVEH